MNLQTATRFTQAAYRALRNSDETQELLVAEEISSVSRMKQVADLFEQSEEGRDILRDRPILSTTTVDFKHLATLPIGTLGRTYVDHLRRCNLDPNALLVPVTRGPDSTSNYLLERIRQTHDLWHTMLGLGTTGYEEVLVHAFQWPQLRMPYSALVVFFGTFKHFIGERRIGLLRHNALGDAIRAGRAAHPLVPVYWERHFAEPIEQLRSQLAIRPASTWRAFAHAHVSPAVDP